MLLLEPATEKRAMPPLFEGDLPPACAVAPVALGGKGCIALADACALPYALSCARQNVRALCFSLCLHGIVVLVAFAAALVEPEALAVQGGGAISVSLVLPQEGKAGAISAGNTAATQAEPVPVPPSEKSDIAPEIPPPDAVPIPTNKVTPPPKKSQETPRSEAKQPPKKAKVQTTAQTSNERNNGAPKDESNIARDTGTGSGAASGNKGKAAATVAGGGELDSAVAPTVAWNSSGGPRFLHQAPLRYPRMAQRRNQEGRATVEAHLDAGGNLLRARIVQADQEDFGKAALDCVQSSTFAPAQSGGKPMACVVRIPMLFVLRDL